MRYEVLLDVVFRQTIPPRVRCAAVELLHVLYARPEVTSDQSEPVRLLIWPSVDWFYNISECRR